ncbi:hypothetical protein CDAR_456561, partial [Caerostris darwini]
VNPLPTTSTFVFFALPLSGHTQRARAPSGDRRNRHALVSDFVRCQLVSRERDGSPKTQPLTAVQVR